MPVDTRHPEYELMAPQWQRARAVLTGEDAVKALGTQVLPKVEGHSPLEYDAYRARASFYNAAARTASAYVGTVYRRPATIVLPNIPALRPIFESDADLLGTHLQDYGRQVLTEVVNVGRCGTLINWDDESQRPHCVLYRAEDIINWRVERVAGKYRLTRVVLREWYEGGEDPFKVELREQYRVLKVNTDGRDATPLASARLLSESDANGVASLPYCSTELWRFASRAGQWVRVEEVAPLRDGQRVPYIPFAFHGPSHSRASVSPLPLGDLISVNLDHYRLDADYKHGMHFTALPTVYLAGFGPQQELKIGSGSVWMSENPQAKAGYLEYYGHGLTSFERALERDERLLALLGSRLLEPPKRQAETAEALELRGSAEQSVLGGMALALSQSLSDMLRWCVWWAAPEAQSPGDVPESQALYALNQDFGTNGLAAEDLQALVAGWQAGAFSHDTLLHLLRKGEVLPDGRTNEQERTLIKSHEREV